MSDPKIWDYPKAILTTKYGTREITVTDANHVHVSHDGYDQGTAKYLGPLRGIGYHVSAHLHRWSDGSWHIGANEGFGFNYDFIEGKDETTAALEKRTHDPDQWKKRQENASSLYMTRAGAFNDASKSAREAIGKEIERAFNEWIKTTEAAEAFEDGQEKYLRRELESTTEEMNKTFAAYQIAEKKANDANEALTQFLGEREGVKA